MSKYLRSKKGSTSVFLTAITLSMIMVIGILAEAASGRACYSYAQGVLNLASRSIMTEYHRSLKQDYGLFGFYGDRNLIEEKLSMYMNASSNKGEIEDRMDLLRWRTDYIRADVSGYSLTDPDLLEEEIYKYMKYHFAEKTFEEVFSKTDNAILEIQTSKDAAKRKKSETENLEKSLENKEDQMEGNNAEGEKIKEGRKKLKKIKAFGDASMENAINGQSSGTAVLRNKAVLETLPSEILDRPGGIHPGGIKTAAVNEYILDTFRNQLDNGEQRDRFFRNEVEYILHGSPSDGENYKVVKAELAAMRLSLNIAFLYADAAKRSETLALATSLTPGPWAPITQFIIITAWAGAETANDLRLLEEGKKVPLMKDNLTWATSLEGMTEGSMEKSSKELGDTGLDYKGYLRILLTMKNREEKLIRIMDLIQINLKGKCDEGFQLQDYLTGFQYRAEISKISGFFPVMETGRRQSELEGICEY